MAEKVPDVQQLVVITRALHDEVRTLRAEVEALKAAARSKATTSLSRVTPDQFWLTSRQTRTVLRVGDATLALVVRAGLLKRVAYLNGYRFERGDVERLARIGLPSTAQLQNMVAKMERSSKRRTRATPRTRAGASVRLEDWRPPRSVR